MPLKLDKFTWTIVLVVLLLLIGAVGTILVAGEQPAELTYLNEDRPAAVVHDAYVAFLKSDAATARQYYSQRIVDEADKNNTFENHFSPYPDVRNQRLRVLEVEMQTQETALVEIAVDRYSAGGLFDSSSIWTDRYSLALIREEGQWKIDTQIFFY